MTLETVTAEEDGRAPFARRSLPWVHCVSPTEQRYRNPTKILIKHYKMQVQSVT